MAYTYTELGGVKLPLLNATQDHSTGTVDSTLISTVNGKSIDFLEGQRRLPRGHRIALSGIYKQDVDFLVDHNGDFIVDHNGDFILTGDEGDTLRAQVNAIRRLIGDKHILKRVDWDSTEERVTEGRVMQVQMINRHTQRQAYADLRIILEVSDPLWRSVGLTTTTDTLATGVNTFTVSSLGEEEIDDAEIFFVPTSTLTSVEFKLNDSHWIWTGTCNAGQELAVRAGPEAIGVDGLGIYPAGFLQSDHLSPSWFTLQPSTNNIEITTNAPCAVTMRHFDKWM